MAEKRYPQDEEENIGVACEPMAVMYDSVRMEASDIEVDFGGFDFGFPQTAEEKLASIEQAEQDMNTPEKWVPAEQMWATLKQNYLWLK